MNEAPEIIWAEPDGIHDIIIHNGASNLDGLIATGYLTKYVRADRIEELEAKLERAVDGLMSLVNAYDEGDYGRYLHWEVENHRQLIAELTGGESDD